MKVLKFGGSSLANADKFINVANIVHSTSLRQTPSLDQKTTSDEPQSQNTQVSVVLSAPQGVTNLLVSLVENLDYCSDTGNLVNSLQTNLLRIKVELCDALDVESEALNNVVTQQFERLDNLLSGAKLLGHCPDQTAAQILSFGERLSINFLSFIFTQKNIEVSLIEPENFLVAENQSGETVADIPLSKEKFSQQYKKLNHISLMPGFVGISPNNRTITLGRNGSDYSAAILAVCAQANVCEIWTDVDGVYNADPRLVKQAELIQKMSFNEAIELSYFGAKILHPKTIVPLSSHGIPCLIKNSSAPEKEGTLISEQSCNENNVKAISSLDEVAMIDVSGPGMKGKVGMTSRIFAAINRANLPVILISQSSAAYRISFCVSSQQALSAVECLNQEFELELKNCLLEPIIVTQGLSVVSLVGDQMQKQKGIAAKFFASLSQARVNIIAIAQDSSERSISAVIRGKRTDDAVKVCHRNLFLKRSSIDAFIIGTGTVGNELLQQIEKQQASLLTTRNIDLKVYGIATSKHFLLANNGIDLKSDWKNQLQQCESQFSLEFLNQFVEDNHLLNPVIIDATSNESIAMSYADYLSANYHVVAANKKANTASMEYYHQLRSAAQKNQRRFLYETNVAAGLPVIDNLQNLLGAGDQLLAFEGILSGSLSYIFGELHNGLSLSEATQKAKDLGYTEPNPAEDLSGLDVARKVLIIAREAGLNLELDDLQLESILSDELLAIDDGEQFMQQLPSLNDKISAQVKAAEAEGKVLRHVAKISDGVCHVKIQAVDSSHPLFSVKGGENALAIHTHYYQPIPFVIRGYGAGAAVTAAGLFADMLRTLVWDLE